MPENRVEKLMNLGFEKGPESIECLISLPINELNFSRRFRKKIYSSLHVWQSRNLSLTIYDVESFGLEKLIDQIYFPIFVRYFYTRGISPYGAHNLESFKQFVKPEHYLAVVTSNKEIVGAAILIDKKTNANSLFLRGNDCNGKVVEGFIYALKDSLLPCRRAFILGMANAFGDLGYNWLSLGVI